MKVLISGASVAGPVLAYWLHRYGFEPTIVERTPAPVIPMALSGLWDSLFARHAGKMKRTPARLGPRVRVSIGEAVAPADAVPQSLRATVATLRGEWR